MKRRDFLRGFAALPFVASSVAGFAAPVRAPFVVPGEIVDSIVWHLWDEPMAPVGPVWVHEVLPWDGKGYPIVIKTIGHFETLLYDGWYDHEWANLRREVPGQFWAMHGNEERYPNVHAYIRELRFGEHPSVMRRTMERNHQLGPGAFHREVRHPRKLAA